MTLYLKKHPLWIIVAVWIIWYGVLRIIQHYTFNTNAVDLSIFDYAVANTLQGNPLHTFYGNQSYLGYHFSPVLFLIVPLYFLYNDPLTMVLLQVVMVGLSAIPLFYIVKTEFQDTTVAVTLTITYLLYRKLSAGVMYDFHMEMFEPLFVFSAFYFALKKKFLNYFVFLFLALSIKEDVSLYLIPLGIYIAAVLKERRVGLISIAVCAVWFVLATKISPAFSNTKELFYLERGFYSQFGSSFTEIFVYFLTHPLEILSKIFNPLSIKTFFNVMGSLFFIPLINFSTALLTAVPLLVNFVSESKHQNGLALYYVAPVMPFLFISLVYGLKKIQARFFPEKKKWLYGLCYLILTVNVLNSQLWQLMKPKRIVITEHHRIGHQLVKEIPREASLSVQVGLFPHVPRRENIFLFPEGAESAEYVFLDTRGNQWPTGGAKYLQFVQDLKESPNHTILQEKDGFLIFKRLRE